MALFISTKVWSMPLRTLTTYESEQFHDRYRNETRTSMSKSSSSFLFAFEYAVYSPRYEARFRADTHSAASPIARESGRFGLFVALDEEGFVRVSNGRVSRGRSLEIYQMRRQSTIANPFAEVIAKATTCSEDECEKKERTPLKPVQHVSSHRKTARSKRKSAPGTTPSSAARNTHRDTCNDVAVLRERCNALTRENQALKARVRARATADKRARASCVEKEETEPEAPEAAVQQKSQPRRFSVGATRFSLCESKRRGSIASVKIVSRSPTAKSKGPLACFACYGAAALDGECGPRLAASPLVSSAGSFRVRPAELCAVRCDDNFEVPWAALPAFACPDGVGLEILDTQSAQTLLKDGLAKSHVSALRSDSGLVYLVTHTCPSVERFVRPGSVKKSVSLASDLADTANDYEDGALCGAHITTPLTPAQHLLPPRQRQQTTGDVLVGCRAYAALTLREDAARGVLRFLQFIAEKDRKADLAFLREKEVALLHGKDAERHQASSSPEISHPASALWQANWDNDDDDDDDVTVEEATIPTSLLGPTNAHLSFQKAGDGLAKFVRNAANDETMWSLLTMSSMSTKSSLRDSSSMRDWAVASLLSLVSAEVVCRAVDEVLREKSIVVVADDASRAGAVALGLTSLLEPLEWQGTLIMTLPCNEVELLGSPCPFVAGCSTWTAAVADAHFASDESGHNPLLHVRSLFVDRQYDAQFSYSARDAPPPDPSLLSLLSACCRNFHRGEDVVGLLAGGMEEKQQKAVAQARGAMTNYVTRLLGDLATNIHAWKRYGEENVDNGDFDFIPEWFLAPSQARLDLQRDLAHTQMLMSYVHTRR